MADSDVSARIRLEGASVKRVQLEGKKIKFLLIAEADKADTVYADLVRVSDGVTKATVDLTIFEATKDWTLPGQ